MLANSGQIWFYHAPSKRVEKPQELAPPASQIPGLAALDPLDEEAWMREVGVKSQKQPKESDSNYIRLAKQGGRKNLLMFNLPKGISDEPQPYPRVDWFDHHEGDLEKDKTILSHSSWQPPEYMVHEYEVPHAEPSAKDKPEPTVKPKRAPFYTDNISVWKRVDDESKNKRTTKKRIQKKADRLPEIPLRAPKSEPIAFSKLIGGEYGSEWYKNQVGCGPTKTKYLEKHSGKGYLNITEYQQSICHKVMPPKKLKPITWNPKRQHHAEKSDGRELFKLSKFDKVKSKLKVDTN